MKKEILFYLTTFLIAISCAFTNCNAQGGMWTWMKGDSAITMGGVYGTQGVPNILNTPPNKYQGAYCVDNQNIAWVYGGNGGSGSSDLWSYNHATNMWTWVKGPQTQGQPAVYGIKGVAASTNLPHTTHVSGLLVCDSTNNLWHYGNFVNALWKFETATNNWIWVHGDSSYNTPAVYGIKGVSSPTNVPPQVIESKSMWYCKSDHHIYLYDNRQCMWRYNINTNEWVWLKGDSLGAYYKYGTKGIEDSTNQPPPTLQNNKSETHVIWQDKQDKLYIYDQTKAIIWRYNPLTNNWMWLHGDTMAGVPPIIGPHCTRGLNLKPSGGNLEARGASAQLNGQDVFYLYSGVCWDNILWRFDLDSLEWIRVSGGGTPSYFGIQTQSNPSNHPPAADGHCLWADHDNNVWLFSTYPFGPNFLWRFKPDPCCGFNPNSNPINNPLPSSISICKGDTTKIPIDTTLNIVVIASSNNSFTLLQDSLLLHPSQNSSYTIYASQSNACTKDTFYTQIDVINNDSIIHYALDNVICLGETSTLQIENGYDIVIKPFINISINTDTSQISFSPDATTTYTLITQTNGQCPSVDTISFTIQVSPNVIANFNVEPFEASIDYPNFTYINTSVNANSFEWIYNNSIFSTSMNATKSFSDTGLYCITLVASNENCVDSITKCNRIVDSKFFIPNSFTPNSDNLNDTFKPLITHNYLLPNYSMKIFNRYGEKVFISYDQNKGWNGEYKNRPCEVGVYYYFINFMKGGEKILYKGDVTLIR